jgi:hypothetical protein
MKLVTFENSARQSQIGALLGERQIVDLNLACALYLRDVEGEPIFYRMADALVPPDMRALFQRGDTSLEAARKALDYVAHLDADFASPRCWSRHGPWWRDADLLAPRYTSAGAYHS